MSQGVVEQQIVDFLRSITGETGLERETDLQAAGATDSLTMMDLLVFVETTFQLRLDFGDLTPEVFRTPSTLAALIVSRQCPTVQRRAA
jgi:methoxymalonate biosynthesis acyl carrier protein